MKKWNVKTTVTIAMLVAIHIVLSRFLSINAWNIKIGFAFVPVFIAAYYYGPTAAAIVNAVCHACDADFTSIPIKPEHVLFRKERGHASEV